MKHLLPLLILTAPYGAVQEWTPPANPDPRLILREARDDARARRFEDALAKHVWFHDNALEYLPSLYGVRLSFALADWYDLAKRYPPALMKLKEFRDDALEDVATKANPRRSFHEFLAINHALGEEGRTRIAFLLLDAENPDIAKEVYDLAQPELVHAKAYEVCGKYIDPTRFEEIVGSYRKVKQLDGNTRVGASLQKLLEDQFTNHTATLIALLVLNERRAEAEELTREAKEEWNDPSFHAAIDEALQGVVPVPWP